MSTPTISQPTDKPINKPVFQEPSLCFWTDAKVQQAWLGAQALLTLSGAITCSALSFTESRWWSIPAISLFLVTGAIVWHSSSIIDYDNPEQLAVVRAEAANMPLMKIVEKHGWIRLFQYAILDTAQFDTAYRTLCNGLDLKELIQNYLLIKNQIQKAGVEGLYSIPSPSEWKSKLEEETGGFNFRKIVYGYCLSDIISYHLLSPEQFVQSFNDFASKAPVIEIIRIYEKVKQQIVEAGRCCNSEFIQQFSISMPPRLRRDFAAEWGGKKASEIALSFSGMLQALVEHELISSEGCVIIKKAQNESAIADQFILRVRRENKNHLESCEKILKQACELADKTYDDHPSSQQLKDSDQRERDEKREIDRKFELDKQFHPDRMNELVSKKNDKVKEVSSRYSRLRSSCEEALLPARRARDRAHQLAKEQFDMARDALKRELDQSIQRIKINLTQQLDVINREFDQLHLFG